VEYEVDRFARKHSLDLRLITVDHHAGQPFLGDRLRLLEHSNTYKS
jgi:hypothetical protein